MINPIILKGKTLSINNRLFSVRNIWFLGLKASRYELQETKNNKDIGDMIIKDAKTINALLENGKITVI